MTGISAVLKPEKKVDRALVPHDWVKIIEESRQVHPFQVNEMTQEHILDPKTYAEANMKASFTDNNGQKLKFRDVMWFSYGQSEVYNDTFTEVTMRKSGADTLTAMPSHGKGLM
ncbi:hypothetical protein RRG08_057468 [Elysia crispata]|uniref:Uncharacterized protein n=1 Tax=Elysia crispata TaxID=231223 RepID=A0AAE0YD64_9GAST|nr:hypothetical protein RRG08_057468 [Elysia crispata]